MSATFSSCKPTTLQHPIKFSFKLALVDEDLDGVFVDDADHAQAQGSASASASEEEARIRDDLGSVFAGGVKGEEEDNVNLNGRLG
jgi:hypothetical protein